ncbi:IclR family transcriptional regulator [Starkeya koreensis]|uniref:IclR family transcriptional regulator n=1 Tax=Ancylobacter koreensis TaxID=266121 RepID=A0ABT0DRI6_9HYPH|nr:IclR family transcriptional regulator [Ancylobacter koreensis]MCK0209732.1 IclR family transcriptional regulator [Ancylobacter koreensis]
MPKVKSADAELDAAIVGVTGGVQSLHRAMAILQSVARARQGIGLAELSKEVGLHSSTTFHLAKTLVTLGLMRQEPESKRYRVGPRLFSLASGALDELELLNAATPFLTALADETGENSHIAVRAGREVVIIGKCDGTASIRLAERIGSARPPHATAIGKILLSALSDPQLDAFLASISLTAITAKTIVDADLLKAAIREAGRNAIAFDDGEFDPDVRCLAAPVFDFRNRMIAAIGISAPVWRLGLNRIGEISALVQQAGRDLSVQLGHVSDPTKMTAG